MPTDCSCPRPKLWSKPGSRYQPNLCLADGQNIKSSTTSALIELAVRLLSLARYAAHVHFPHGGRPRVRRNDHGHGWPDIQENHGALFARRDGSKNGEQFTPSTRARKHKYGHSRTFLRWAARCKLLIPMVGAEGFEPPTLCSQSRCATRLRYAPIPGLYRNQRPSGVPAEPLQAQRMRKIGARKMAASVPAISIRKTQSRQVCRRCCSR